MKEHEHAAKNEPTKPAQDEVARKAIVQLSRATYRKMIQNLFWATDYNAFAIPVAAGALYAWGLLLSPAFGPVLMSASTVIVAINARMLKLK